MDDTTLFASADSLKELFQFVNCEFHKIVTFFCAHKIALHPSKTKFILFNSSKTDILNLDLNVYINNNNGNDATLPLIPIENVNKNSKVPAAKFLSIYIDPLLSFNYHVQHIASKI
jgi:hypothetical protein